MQNQLRQQRTEGLQAMAATTVHSLLHDVGLHITGLSVQGTKAAMEITDVSGKPVSLSMLSAGQRNALLLAPLLAAADAGVRAAPTHSVAVQLHGQQAKAYARMGMPEKVHEARGPNCMRDALQQ